MHQIHRPRSVTPARKHNDKDNDQEKDSDNDNDKDEDKDKDESAENLNICYIFENPRIQGYQI